MERKKYQRYKNKDHSPRQIEKMMRRLNPRGNNNYQFHSDLSSQEIFQTDIELYYDSEFLLSHGFEPKVGIKISDFDKEPESACLSVARDDEEDWKLPYKEEEKLESFFDQNQEH